MVPLLTLLEDQDSLGDFDALGWRTTEGLQFLDGLDLKAVDGLGGSLHCRNSLSELAIGRRFLSLGRVGELDGLCLLHSSGLGLFLSIQTLSSDNLDQFIGLLLLNANIDHLDFQKLLQSLDLLSGALHRLETDLKPVDLVSDLSSLLAEQEFVEVDELEEGGWCGVVVTSLTLEELFVGLTDRQMDLSHVLSNVISNLVLWEINLGEES